MKKAILFALVIAVAGSAIAQKKVMKAARSEYNDKHYEKAYELIQTAKDNDESKVMPETWIVRGKILQAIAKDSALSAKFENPLIEAFKSYSKAIEIEPKAKNEVNLLMLEFTGISTKIGANAYNTKNYEKAYDYFELTLKAEESPIFAKSIDTTIIFYSGMAALKSLKYDKAIEQFNKAISYKYNGAYSYSVLKDAYMQKGDTATGLATLKKAFETYPNDLTVIIDLINYYLQTGQPNEALNYLNMAKQKDPNNASYWFAEGTLYEKMKQPDNAVVSYVKATELNPKNLNAFFNLGVLFFNNGVEINKQATNENDNFKYGELIKKRDEEFKKAIPYFEKAHALSPKDEDIAKSLKSIYVNLQMDDKVKELKAEMNW